MKKTFMSLGLVLIVILALSGCYEWPDPIYNPDEEGLPVPTISSVDKTTLLGGIDQLTITGSGFGTVEEEVLVYFKKGTTVGRGRTLNVTDTEVLVEAPAVYSDSLEIWLDRIGCFEYAIYDETPITVEKGLIKIPIVTPLTFNKVAINENAEMTVALGSSADMFHISADDSVTTLSDVSFSNSLNVLSLRTKGSDIYYTLREYVAKYDGGSLDRSAVNGDKNPLNDFVFAENGKVYYVALNNIYSTNHDFSGETPAVQTEDFNFKQCAFYDGKLYVSSVYTGDDTLRSNEKAIMAYPANSDGSLGTPETVINWTEDFAGSVISGITFDADGKMYVATQTKTPVYVIDPVGGSYAGGDISLLYPVLLDQKILSMNWDMGGYMAYIGEDNEGTRSVFRLKMLPQPSPSYIP